MTSFISVSVGWLVVLLFKTKLNIEQVAWVKNDTDVLDKKVHNGQLQGKKKTKTKTCSQSAVILVSSLLADTATFPAHKRHRTADFYAKKRWLKNICGDLSVRLASGEAPWQVETGPAVVFVILTAHPSSLVGSSGLDSAWCPGI